MARDAALELRFDRPLLPKSATSANVAVYPQGNSGSISLEPEYDVIERVVAFRISDAGAFEPGLLYEVEIRAPRDNPGKGFRAYDGAPLAEDGPVPLRFSFRTTTEDPPAAPSPKPPPSCSDFIRTLDRGTCLECHSAGLDPPMGLRMGSAEDLAQTAIDRVAHETDTGPVAGRVLVDPPRFGVGMAVIAPHDPASSYLFYKALEAPDTYQTDGCTSVHTVALPAGQCLALSSSEVARMQAWFLRMSPMPPPGNGFLTLSDLRLVQDYIRAGASLDGCP